MTGEPMEFDTLCALLVNEPFNLRMEEIAQLTDYQIRRIYFHPRTENGMSIDVNAYSPNASRGPLDYKRAFWESWTDKGATDAEIQSKWDEIEAVRPGGE